MSLSATQKLVLRSWLEGAGLAFIYLLPPLAVVLVPGSRSSYHQLLPMTGIIRGLILDMVLLSCLVGAWLVLVRSRSGFLQRLLYLPFFLSLFWAIGRGIAYCAANQLVQSSALSWTSRWTLRLALLLVVSLVPVAILLPAIYRRLVAASELLLVGVGIAFVVVALPRMAAASLNHLPLESASFERLTHTGDSDAPRIVWILFDELSYNQTFEHRAPGVNLPAFKGLAEQSLSFTDLRPIGDRTDRIIPSLFLGQSIQDIKSDAEGNLLWKPSRGERWRAFDASQTIFAEAKQSNWTTGVAGWYNPYCRLLARVLDWCFWCSSEPVAGDLFRELSSSKSALANAVAALPLADRVERSLGYTSLSAGHRSDTESLMQQGNALIRDSAIRFVFIHVPVPHPPGIERRDRASNQAPGYVDNLAIADRLLSQYQASINSSPSSGRTVLVVSSDHSWRTYLWRGAPSWTQEDEDSSHKGVFDDRPVLMVHFPKDTHSIQLGEPVSALAVHGILLGLLQAKFDSEASLQSYLSTLPSTPPK